jgi:hypothetical protein
MQKCLATTFLAVLAVAVGVAAVTTSAEKDDGASSGNIKLPDNWGESVLLKDLTDEISESVNRMGQNLKKPSDFDKFLKSINSEGHLTAILAGLALEHPESGSWKGSATQIQAQGLAIAKAAEAKGAKNFRSAQDAHKKIVEVLKKKSGGGAASNSADSSTDWASLGALGDIMKRVDSSYKYVRGKMSSESAFKKETETIRHNAAMLYIYGQISPAFRPAEADMPKLSGAMSVASADLLEAVRAGDFGKANEANTAINNACNECHKAKRFQKKGSELDF